MTVFLTFREDFASNPNDFAGNRPRFVTAHAETFFASKTRTNFAVLRMRTTISPGCTAISTQSSSSHVFGLLRNQHEFPSCPIYFNHRTYFVG